MVTICDDFVTVFVTVNLCDECAMYLRRQYDIICDGFTTILATILRQFEF